MSAFTDPALLGPVVLGLVLGAVFGIAARLGRFCLLRGMKGLWPGGDLHALRAYGLGLAVALLATQILGATGGTDLSRALPLMPRFAWGGMLAGGVIFGLGMVLANACGARSVVLMAGGNLRSLVVLLCLGLAAQASLTGVLAAPRLWLQGFGQVAPTALTVPQLFGGSALALALSVAVPVLALGALALPLIRRRPAEAAMAVLVGLCVAGGWWVTFATDDPFEPKTLVSLSYTGPVGETILWSMLSTGRAAGFPVALVGGTFLGALLAALISRSFRWEGFESPARMLRAALGGILMGFGGVLALGCSIGQGLSGVSTLSLASLVATAGILIGIAGGLVLFRGPETTRA